MPVESEADRAIFLSPNDFGSVITYNGGTINGIFDNDTIELDSITGVPMLQESPRVECRTSDIPSIAQGQVMIISAVAYTIQSWVHDGKGMTKVELDKQ